MEKVSQNPCEIVLELQVFDLSRLPETPPFINSLREERFIAGEASKSGAVRSKNAITYKKKFAIKEEYGKHIKEFAVEICQATDFWKEIDSIGYRSAFIRARIPVECLEFISDFNVDVETLKVLISRNLSLDFWFIENDYALSVEV